MQKENTKKRKENDLISSCIECDLSKYQYKLTKMCAPYSGTCTCTSNGSKQVHKQIRLIKYVYPNKVEYLKRKKADIQRNAQKKIKQTPPHNKNQNLQGSLNFKRKLGIPKT